MHHVPSQEQEYLPRGRGPTPLHNLLTGANGRIPAGGSPTRGTTNFGLGRLPNTCIGGLHTAPLLPSATSFEPSIRPEGELMLWYVVCQ